MRKALLIATVLGCACRSKGTHPGGLIADVHLVNQPKVTCADVLVRDADGAELGRFQAAFTGGKTRAQVAIGGEGFPADVVISVQPGWSTDGCTAVRANGGAVEHAGHFTAGKIDSVQFDLDAPSSALDGDGDGFAGLTFGGPDCDDANGLAFPTATESCTVLADLDCDGQSGCADAQCAAVSGCAQPAERLVFVTTPTPVTPATCSAALTVESRTAAGQPANLPPGAIVALSANPAAGVAFFSDAACTTPVSQLVLVSAANQHTFFFTAAMAGSIDVTASSTGLTPATQTQTVLPPSASQLAFATPPRSVAAGGCTMLIEVEARDGAGVPRGVAADVTAQLAVAPAAAVSFHADVSCATAAITSVTIAAAQTKASLYVKGVATGAHTVTATATGLAPGSQLVTVNAGPPARLFFTTSQQGVPVNQCSGAASVRAEDAQGNAVALSAALTIDLTQSGATMFAFYGDAACAGPTVTSVPLAAPLGSVATFYFKGQVPGMASVQAAAAGSALTPATQIENIGAGNPFALKFTTPLRSVQAGACSQPVTLEVQDPSGFPRNPPTPISVSLTGTPDAGFAMFSDALCAVPLPQPLVIMGSPTGTFRFSPQRAPSQRIDATAAGLMPDNQVHPVTPAAAQRLRITTTPLTVTAGTCSAPLHVDITDTYGNAVSVTNLPVSLATTAMGVTFFSDTGACTTAMPPTVTTATGFDFRFIGNVAGLVPLTVSSTGLLQAAQTETVNAGTASTLFIAPPGRTQLAGSCSPQPLTVVTRDSVGNTVNTTANLTVNLSASDGGITFYDQASCAAAAVGSVQIANGTSSQSFWFIGRKSGISSVTASATLFTSAKQDETITAGDASRVAITTPAPLSLQVNTCSAGPVTFETQDAFGNLAPLTGMVTFGLDGGASVQTYSAAACGTPVQSVTLTSGQSSGTFHVRGSPAGSAGVSVGANLFTPDSLPITLTPGPTQLAYSTLPQTKYAGECSGTVTVQARDATNAPINVNASTTVSLTARTGFTFFSDSGCTAPVTQLTLPAGQNQVSYWFRGITGGSTTLDATSPGLTAASEAVIIISAVRSGTCTIAQGQFTVSCTVAPALLATDRTFLVFQTLSDLDNDTSGEVLARCHIENQGQITCTRGGNPGGGKTIQIFWQTATLPTAVSVEHVKNVACSGTLPSPVSVTDTGGISDVFTLHSSSHNGGQVDDNEHDEVTMTSSTNVNLNHAGAACTAANTHDLQVVQYTGATVARGNLLLDAGFTTVDVPALSTALGRSFLLYSWRTASTGNDMCEREVRGTLPDATTVSFSRANGSASALCSDDAWMGGSWERVTLPSGCRVQAVDVALPSGSTSTAVNFAAPIDPTRTLVFTGTNTWGGQGGGEIDVTNDPDVSHVAGHFTLDGGSQVIAVRGTSNGAIRYAVWVVELDPY